MAVVSVSPKTTTKERPEPEETRLLTAKTASRSSLEIVVGAAKARGRRTRNAEGRIVSVGVGEPCLWLRRLDEWVIRL